VTGLRRVVKVRVYKLNEGISESLLYAGIGVEGGVNPPRGIRTGLTCQTPSEAPSVRVE
jgi:putative transposase